MGVWLVTGVQAAGESTVADLLARRHRLSALAAGEYADAGFTAVVQADSYGPEAPITDVTGP